jgi:transposase
VIATLEATVVQLTARVGELLARLDTATGDDPPSGRPQGMPGLKPALAKARPPQGPRKRRGQQFVRYRMEPTTRIIHMVEHRPTCGLTLTGGTIKRTREVIEVPLVPAVVTEHVYLERRCPHCRTRQTPTVDLKGEVVGRQRLGVGLVSLIATLREEARLPVATIQRYLATFHAVAVSGGAIVGATQRVARAGAGAAAAIRAAIRGSPCVHGDETGWREDGVNGYVWTFCTPTAQ